MAPIVLSRFILQAIGVINDAGELIQVLSVNDLRSVGYDEQLFQRLYLPVGQFIQIALQSNSTKPRALITAKFTDTFGEVLQTIVKSGVHRLYIVDENKPVGVISLSDILKLFA